MAHVDVMATIQRMSQEIKGLPTETDEWQHVKGFLFGVIHGLARAAELAFVDHTGPAIPNTYSAELDNLLDEISAGRLPADGQWLAGFYFNSALQRLGALYHKVLKMLTNKKGYVPELKEIAIKQHIIAETDVRALDKVHDEVNKLKHNLPSLLMGREVTIEEAVDAANEAIKLFKRTI